MGWAAGSDHYENWTSNRIQQEASVIAPDRPGVSVANEAPDSSAESSDNRTKAGQAIPGFLVSGTIENGAVSCPSPSGCPGDTASVGHVIAGHTASDVPLSDSGPGARQFTGVYENSDVFLKVLRASAGTYSTARRIPARTAAK